jgi:hypothetical protein
MKTNASKLALCSMFILSAFAASALPATYSVNMGVQMTLGNFNPGAGDQVRVAGTFTSPDWVTTSILTVNPTNSNIYEGTFDGDQAAGAFENHKFIIDVGGTGGTLNWETGGNRFFQIPNGPTNLATVYFNDITNANSLIATQVTFQVDMSVQIQLGNFAPASDVVYVAGDAINNWVAGASVLSPNGVNPNIYEGTFTITNTVGTTVNFKYIMNTFTLGQNWESDGVGPNGAQNRQFVFPNAATNLPVVFFNNITNANSFVVSPVTFTVNTAVMNARGLFDPSSGTVNVAGDAINNWSAVASPLTQSPGNPNLWSGTFNVTNTAGATANFKFVLNGGGTWEDNGVGPGGVQNRQFAQPTSATNLPAVFFNNVANLGSIVLTNVSGNHFTYSWNGGPNIRLQKSTNLSSSWVDLADTLGMSTATVTNTGNAFYRLIGP